MALPWANGAWWGWRVVMVASGSLYQCCHQPNYSWCPSKAFSYPLVAQSLPYSFSLPLLSSLSSPGVFFSISTVKRVSHLPFPPSTGRHQEGGRDTGLNRSHTNSPRLTAPPWAPRQGTDHCSGESAPQTAPCTPCLPPASPKPIPCLLSPSCLAPSHKDSSPSCQV